MSSALEPAVFLFAFRSESGASTPFRGGMRAGTASLQQLSRRGEGSANHGMGGPASAFNKYQRPASFDGSGSVGHSPILQVALPTSSPPSSFSSASSAFTAFKPKQRSPATPLDPQTHYQQQPPSSSGKRVLGSSTGERPSKGPKIGRPEGMKDSNPDAFSNRSAAVREAWRRRKAKEAAGLSAEELAKKASHRANMSAALLKSWDLRRQQASNGVALRGPDRNPEQSRANRSQSQLQSRPRSNPTIDKAKQSTEEEIWAQRSAAARKGWELRREHAQLSDKGKQPATTASTYAQRSAASRKGWDLRREHAEDGKVKLDTSEEAFAARAAASRKGWENRRQAGTSGFPRGPDRAVESFFNRSQGQKANAAAKKQAWKERARAKQKANDAAPQLSRRGENRMSPSQESTAPRPLHSIVNDGSPSSSSARPPLQNGDKGSRDLLPHQVVRSAASLKVWQGRRTGTAEEVDAKSKEISSKISAGVHRYWQDRRQDGYITQAERKAEAAKLNHQQQIEDANQHARREAALASAKRRKVAGQDEAPRPASLPRSEGSAFTPYRKSANFSPGTDTSGLQRPAPRPVPPLVGSGKSAFTPVRASAESTTASAPALLNESVYPKGRPRGKDKDPAASSERRSNSAKAYAAKKKAEGIPWGGKDPERAREKLRATAKARFRENPEQRKERQETAAAARAAARQAAREARGNPSRAAWGSRDLEKAKGNMRAAALAREERNRAAGRSWNTTDPEKTRQRLRESALAREARKRQALKDQQSR